MSSEVSDLIFLIPEGKENAISRNELVMRSGKTDREVRREIQELRAQGFFICNNQDGKGYYVSTDIEELRQQYKSDTARAMAILKRRKSIRDYLKSRGIPV